MDGLGVAEPMVKTKRKGHSGKTHKQYRVYVARRHLRSNGTPKMAYREEQVEQVAVELRDKGRDVEPYLCDECEMWHFGRSPRHKRFGEQDLMEMGPRIEASLRLENVGDRAGRLRIITQRWNGVWKRLKNR